MKVFVIEKWKCNSTNEDFWICEKELNIFFYWFYGSFVFNKTIFFLLCRKPFQINQKFGFKAQIQFNNIYSNRNSIHTFLFPQMDSIPVLITLEKWFSLSLSIEKTFSEMIMPVTKKHWIYSKIELLNFLFSFMYILQHYQIWVRFVECVNERSNHCFCENMLSILLYIMRLGTMHRTQTTGILFTSHTIGK